MVEVKFGVEFYSATSPKAIYILLTTEFQFMQNFDLDAQRVDKKCCAQIKLLNCIQRMTLLFMAFLCLVYISSLSFL